MFEFCWGEQPGKKSYPAQILVEYSNHDPQSGRYQSHIERFEAGKILEKYTKWKRMKFKSKDKKSLVKGSYFSSFIDEEFPHNNNSITTEDTDVIEWKRVTDVIKMAIYSSSDTFNNFERIALRNKTLKQALSFMKRTHPSRFKKLLAQDLSPQGIYQFRLYHGGSIQNVIIDDYFPFMGGQFLFANPIRQKQIFPMLIEKAIAKICGSYELIPEDVDEMLEMLFCGPLRKTKILELSDREKVIENIEKVIGNNKGVGGFISKREAKIRNFGINENQLYNIIGFHSVYPMGSSDKVYLIELVSEKKLVAWNGKYSHNDSNWDKIDPADRSRIFQSFKNNKSFCVSAQDIPRIFETLILFDGTQNQNKDWVENVSESNYPSFTTFELKEGDNVFVKLCMNETNRSSIILAKLLPDKQLIYETGAYLQTTMSLQFCKRLAQGKYIICVYNEWTLNKTGNYTIFLSSNEHTCLTRVPENTFPNFLQELCKTHSETMRYQPNPPSYYHWNKFYSVCNFSCEIGFAYLYIKLEDTNKAQRKIQINEKMIQKQGWQLLEPHTGRAQIILDKKITPEVILILRARQHLVDKKLFFPTTAFLIEK